MRGFSGSASEASSRSAKRGVDCEARAKRAPRSNPTIARERAARSLPCYAYRRSRICAIWWHSAASRAAASSRSIWFCAANAPAIQAAIAKACTIAARWFSTTNCSHTMAMAIANAQAIERVRIVNREMNMLPPREGRTHRPSRCGLSRGPPSTLLGRVLPTVRLLTLRTQLQRARARREAEPPTERLLRGGLDRAHARAEALDAQVRALGGEVLTPRQRTLRVRDARDQLRVATVPRVAAAAHAVAVHAGARLRGLPAALRCECAQDRFFVRHVVTLQPRVRSGRAPKGRLSKPQPHQSRGRQTPLTHQRAQRAKGVAGRRQAQPPRCRTESLGCRGPKRTVNRQTGMPEPKYTPGSPPQFVLLGLLLAHQKFYNNRP